MPPPPLIDVRPEPAFLAGHVPGAVGIPLEELPRRVHELPTRETALCVTDSDMDRAAQAAAMLRQRGHDVSVIALDRSALIETGPTRTRLWQPSPFLIEALDRIREEGLALPRRALDVACGSGRDAVYLAINGFHVEAIDILPDALERAADLARRWQVHVETHARDLERDPTLPASRYQLVTVFRYLQRPLFPALCEAIAPGGYIACETFHEKNLETGKRPSSPDHLLKTGELERAFEGFHVLVSRDAIEREGRYFSQILARR